MFILLIIQQPKISMKIFRTHWIYITSNLLYTTVTNSIAKYGTVNLEYKLKGFKLWQCWVMFYVRSFQLVVWLSSREYSPAQSSASPPTTSGTSTRNKHEQHLQEMALPMLLHIYRLSIIKRFIVYQWIDCWVWQQPFIDYQTIYRLSRDLLLGMASTAYETANCVRDTEFSKYLFF